MTVQKRMSPLTAFFLGVFGVSAVGITAVSAIVLYGMRIVDTKAANIVSFAGGTIENLPELFQSLPPALGELLNDRRAPEYAENIDVEVQFVSDPQSGRVQPVLTITNKGSEVVSMLAVRVAALTDKALPVGEWTEVVATPIALDGDWRGPLYPGGVRYVVMSRCRRSAIVSTTGEAMVPAAEISELRLWRPESSRVASNDGR